MPKRLLYVMIGLLLILSSCAKAAPIKDIDFLLNNKWCVYSDSDVKCYEFFDDYTFVYSRKTQKYLNTYEGTYTINKKQIVLIYDDYKEFYNYSYSDEPISLTLTYVRKENIEK